MKSKENMTKRMLIRYLNRDMIIDKKSKQKKMNINKKTKQKHKNKTKKKAGAEKKYNT